MEKRRLFVALPVPLTIRQSFLSVVAEQESNWQAARSVPIENMHITVFFLGDTSKGDVPRIKESLRKVAKDTAPFILYVQEAIWAPPSSKPRMLWINFQESGAYRKLVQAVASELKMLSEQEAIPHVTLARFAENASLREKQVSSLSSRGEKLLMTGYELLESSLSKEGAQYNLLAEFVFSE